jgi:hypothetical protein
MESAMSKYAPLANYLSRQKTREVRMTFAEIERIIGAKLPPKAQKHRAWWSNNPDNSTMTKAWLEAGFRSEQVDMAGRSLVFRRTAHGEARPHKGMEEATRMYQHEGSKGLSQHPALGSMKGLITVAPGTDLIEPVYSEKEWAEVTEEMERDWDEIAAGLKKPE